MRDNIIDIKAESLPWQVKLMGALFLIGASALIATYWWLSILLAAAGFAVLSWYSGTEIDPAGRTFREYNSCFFIRKGVMERYHEVEKVFINEAKMSQKMYTAHTGSSSMLRYVVFNAYMKLDDGRKIFLTSRKDKQKLLKLLKPVVALLATDLTDNTVAR